VHRRLQTLGRDVTATTRRPDRVAPGMSLLDLAQPLDNWDPPPDTVAACIFVAVARIAACQADPAGSAYVNVTQTLRLVERLLVRGIYVLFLSTNQVFDGTVPHIAADAPHSPVTEYGRQKARTETELLGMMQGGAPVGILRLAKVVSPGMALLRGWVEALAQGKPIRAFQDMTMAPTPTELVATAIAALMNDRARGVFQLTGPRDVSYFDVGCRIAERLGVDPGLVSPAEAASIGMPPGSTPRHTTLDSSLLRERYGLIAPAPWSVLDPFAAVPSSAGCATA
jgi:dTDP-4-dehydrorhamnose reductase